MEGDITWKAAHKLRQLRRQRWEGDRTWFELSLQRMWECHMEMPDGNHYIEDEEWRDIPIVDEREP